MRHFPRFWKKTKVITSREFISIVCMRTGRQLSPRAFYSVAALSPRNDPREVFWPSMHEMRRHEDASPTVGSERNGYQKIHCIGAWNRKSVSPMGKSEAR